MRLELRKLSRAACFWHSGVFMTGKRTLITGIDLSKNGTSIIWYYLCSLKPNQTSHDLSWSKKNEMLWRYPIFGIEIDVSCFEKSRQNVFKLDKSRKKFAKASEK